MYLLCGGGGTLGGYLRVWLLLVFAVYSVAVTSLAIYIYSLALTSLANYSSILGLAPLNGSTLEWINQFIIALSTSAINIFSLFCSHFNNS